MRQDSKSSLGVLISPIALTVGISDNPGHEVMPVSATKESAPFPQIHPIGSDMDDAIRAHLDSLTKPPGSLGVLEQAALQMARVARTTAIADPPAYLLTFAGDHGITAQGVAAYPSDVTPQMVANIAAGGAASSVFCRQFGIEHQVIDVGVAVECDYPGVVQRNVVRGTRDSSAGPAMTRDEASACIRAGARTVEELPTSTFALLGIGEMGIGNSTVAALLACAFARISPEDATGPGTGVHGDQLIHKRDVVARVLDLHRPDPADPVAALAAVGGAEFGAMAGAMLAAAARGWIVVVDGYISGAAALVAMAIDPALKDYLVWSHMSTEPGAGAILTQLGVRPLLELDLRLGEGTGAALAMPILKAALAMMREMATFASAGVSGPGE